MIQIGKYQILNKPIIFKLMREGYCPSLIAVPLSVMTKKDKKIILKRYIEPYCAKINRDNIEIYVFKTQNNCLSFYELTLEDFLPITNIILDGKYCCNMSHEWHTFLEIPPQNSDLEIISKLNTGKYILTTGKICDNILIRYFKDQADMFENEQGNLLWRIKFNG